MGKSTHFIGQPLYSQVLKLLTGQKFFKSARIWEENATQNALMCGFT